MLYKLQVLDYCLVLLGVYLLFKKFFKVKPTWKDGCMADVMVLLLAGMFAMSWLRFPSGYQAFFKILSCFMVYFLGRLYKDEIKVTPYVFVASSYLVVYANFIHRLFRQVFRLFEQASNSGQPSRASSLAQCAYPADGRIGLSRWLSLSTRLSQ